MALLLAIVFVLYEKLTLACLITNPINSKECYCCKQKYYYNFSDDWPGGEVLFNSSECVYQRNVNPLTIDVYISPKDCEKIGSACNGSSSDPFDSLVKAFKYGWRNGWLSQNSSVNFYLLSNGETPESAVYFINKRDFPSEFQYLFRRFYADITIAPLYCESQPNARGCIKNSSLRPIIYVRTSSLYFFISKNLFVKNITFDGSEIGFESQEMVNESTYRAPICTSEALEETQGPCGLKQREIKDPGSFPYGFFNVEAVIDCKVCYNDSSEKLWLLNSEFRYFHSLGKSYAMGSIVSTQNLKFSVLISNSLFYRLAMSYGIINSLKMPPYYRDQLTLYSNGIGTEMAFFVVEASEIRQYNFFLVRMTPGPDKKELIVLSYLTYLPLTFYVRDCLFQENELGKFAFPFVFMFFEIQKAYGYYSAVLNLTNNRFLSNNAECLIKVNKVPVYSEPKHKFQILQNYFLNNINLVLDLILTDIVFEGNLLFNTQIYKQSLFQINYGRVYFKKNLIYFFRCMTMCSLIEFIGVQAITDRYIFNTSAWTNKTYMDLVHFQENYLSNLMNASIFISNFTLNQMIMDGNYFEFIDCEMCHLSKGNVEMNFSITNNFFFKIIKCNVLLSHFMFKNLTLHGNIFLSLDLNLLTSAVIVSPSKPNSVINITQNVFWAIHLNECLISIEGFLDVSLLEINFLNNILANIFGSRSQSFVLLLSYYSLKFSQNTLRSISYNSYLKLSGLGKEPRTVHIDRNIFEGSEFISGYFIQVADFEQLQLRNCSFLNSKLDFDIKAVVQITTYKGSLHIMDCVFKHLSGFASCALTIKVMNYTSFLIKGCLFYRNNFKDVPEISIEIYLPLSSFYFLRSALPLSQFGILSNIFLFSEANFGGAIKVVDGSQLLLQNNYFYDNNAQLGGCIYLDEKANLLSFNNSIYSSSASVQGGFLYSFAATATLINDSVISSWAERGGAISVEDSELNIYFAHFSDCNSVLQGGTIYAQSSKIKILATSVSDTSSFFEGGAVYLKKGSLSLQKIKFTNARSEVVGGALFLESIESLFARSIIFFQCRVKEEGILFLLGVPQYTYTIQDITCDSNDSEGKGECIALREGNLKIEKLNLINCKITSCGLCISATVSKAEILIFNVVMNNITLKSNTSGITSSVNLLVAQGVLLELQAATVSDIKSVPQGVFFYFIDANITLNNINFTSSNSIARTFLIVELSYLKAYFVKLLLKYRMAGLRGIDSYMEVYSSFFDRGINPKEGAGIFLEESYLNMSSSIISGCTAGFGGAIYGSRSDVFVRGCKFINNTALNEGGDFFVLGLGESLSRPNSVIVNQSGFYFAPRLFIKKTPIVILFSAEFVRISEDNRFQSLQIEDSEQALLISVIIAGFNSGKVSSITFRRTNSKVLSLLIRNLSVSSCSTNSSGGAVWIDGPVVGLITNSLFLKNNANENGGAVYMSSNAHKDTNFALIDCLFFGNKAKIYGDSLKALDYVPYIVPMPEALALFSAFSYKIILFWKPPEDFPDDTIIELISKGLDSFSKHVAHQPLEVVSGQAFDLICVVIDAFSNVLRYDTSGKVSFQKDVENQAEIEFENEIQRVRKGVALFQGLNFVAEPGRNYTASMLYSDQFMKISFRQELSFFLRKCRRGEIYVGLRCYKCPESFYSLEVDAMRAGGKSSCLPCPENGKCPGGDVILPLEGYWRKDENQTLLVKCRVAEACPEILEGEATSPFVPMCGYAYQGNLCSGCIDKFGKTDSKNCIYCSLNYSYYLRFCLLVLFSLTLSAYQTYTACDVNETWSKRRCLVKLLIDHMTFTGFISKFNISWTKMILDILAISDSYLTAVPAEMFNFDCILSNIFRKDIKFYMNSVFVSLSPLYYGCLNVAFIYTFKLALYLFDRVKNKIRRRTAEINSFFPKIKINYSIRFQPRNKAGEPTMDFSQIIIATCLIIFYNYYPRLLQNGMEWLRCTKLDNSDRKFLDAFPDLVCWSEDHVISLATTALPSLFAWGLFTPLILFYLTRKMRLRVLDEHKKETKQLLEFITIDYKPDFYYWDLFSYFSKFVVVLCTLITDTFDPASQAAVLILAMLWIFLVQEKLKPYKYPFVNNLRTYSYITTICTSSLAIMASSKTLHNTHRLFYFGALIAFNAAFYVVWALYFFMEGADWVLSKSFILKYWKRFSFKLEKLSRAKFHKTQSKISTDELQIKSS